MIARRLENAEIAALRTDDPVLWLQGGGTQYSVVFFVRVAEERTGWCWVRKALDSPALTPLRLSSLGTSRPRAGVRA